MLCCGPDSVGFLATWPGCGRFWFVCPVPGMWACGLCFVFLTRAVGCLVVGGGCARMWVLGFVYQVFLFRADAPFPHF